MNTTKLRSKRVLASTAVVAALAVGGGVWATTASANDEVRGGDRDRVAEAAVEAAGGGTATDVETSDDRGEAYEVEVRREDGTEVDVTLDKDLKVVTKETDAPDAGTAAAPSGSPEADDRPLTPAEQASAEKAAVAAVPGSTVLDVDRGDRAGVAYEVEVRTTDNVEWNVDLDSAFAVVGKTAD
ncbi:PepSY domain-containing protein [Cryptosporangium arvum]|uniref:PepSY domain-containing protein n=1 Tax=Cryptosporangium arvum TaxID=80871 RepID=UPI0004B81FFA|nr:PepSY domain-containing protein [Cryptosporangium arvum]